MEFRILGLLDVVADGRSLPLGGGKQRALLAALILRANAVVSVDQLLEDLWGEAPPRTAEHSLQVYVSELRKVLRGGDTGGADRITRRGSGYVLRLEADELDAERFARAAALARAQLAAGDAAAAASTLRGALDLWRGPPLADFTFETFAQNDIARLHELRLAATEDRVEADLALGRHPELVAELQTLVAESPARERLRGQLVLALYRCGRQADALQQLATARAILADELGIDPGPDLRRLETAILTQDPQLDPPGAPDQPTREEPQPARREGRTSRDREPDVREVRKIVTILFVDVSGSTALGGRLDPEAMRTVMSRFFEAMREVLERHGASVEKFIGDAVMAVFGIPRVHEDDALRAVRAAVEMRRALSDLNDDLDRELGVTLRTRTGVCSGPVVAGDAARGERLVTGDAVNVAARLEQSAEPTQILIGRETYALVRDAVEVAPLESLAVRGKDDPVAAYELLAVRPDAPGLRRRIDSPIVGREPELATLRHALDRTIHGRECHLFTVLGDAGVGKSRLVEEFGRTGAAEARILRGRCLAYGDGITYWPIVEIVKEAVGIKGADTPEQARERIEEALAAADDAPRIAASIEQILGLTGTDLGEGETLWAARRFVETIALDRPLIVTIEDIHWAEPTLLDLLEGIADWSRDAPILLVCTSRPEILEERPTWAGGKLNATSVMLRPLSVDDTSVLIGNLLGRSGLGQDDRARIADAAEGNPLFVEQMVSMLIDDGILVYRDGTWSLIGDLSATAIPTSIHTLLAARLDGLPAAERSLIERAAVIGREFDAATLEHLTPEPERSGIGDRLRDLVRKDMIRPDAIGSGVGGFRFRHVLIRNAAYESMPKRVRADLHERVADLMEARHRDRFAEYEEIVGHHLELATRYLAELGAGGERARDLARRAGLRLGAAGTRAFARGDMPGAVALMSAAASLLPADEPARVGLLPDLGTALVEIGQMGRADDVFAEAIEAARAREDLPLHARALLYRFEEQLWTGRAEASEASRAEVQRLIDVAEERSDDLSLSWLWRIKSVGGSKLAEEQEASDRAMDHAQRAGDRRGQREILQSLSGLLPTGPMPVPEALARSEEFLEIASGDRVAEAAVVVNARSLLLAMAGRIEESRAESARARETFRALGLRLWLAASGTVGPASAELLVGELSEAERLLREGVASLEAISEQGVWLSFLSKMLVVALARQGKVEDATRSMELVGEPRSRNVDVSTKLEASALILHHAGRPEEAEPLLRRSIELADPDALSHRGAVLMDLAATLRALGREDEAVRTATEALHQFERKGDVVSVERASAFAASALWFPGTLSKDRGKDTP